jgi:hypothetical protein
MDGGRSAKKTKRVYFWPHKKTLALALFVCQSIQRKFADLHGKKFSEVCSGGDDLFIILTKMGNPIAAADPICRLLLVLDDSRRRSKEERGHLRLFLLFCCFVLSRETFLLAQTQT